LLFTACQSNPAQEQTTTVPKYLEVVDSLLIELPYNLDEPQQRYELPGSLDEVSGLSYYLPGQVAMVQDELGRIYVYDLAQRAVVRTIEFAMPGDFEGLEWTGEQFYALRSDGILFRADSNRVEGPNLKMLKNPLNEDDDLEGLGYLPDEQQLLLAGKEPARAFSRNDRYRVIYRYDLVQQALLSEGSIIIDLQHLKDAWQRSATQPKDQERAAEFEVMKEKSFKPSAVAVHPLTGHLYVLASSGKLMVVMNQQGHVCAVHHLSRDPFSQPEGICFSPEGDLFISNEARDETPTLLQFSYQPHD